MKWVMRIETMRKKDYLSEVKLENFSVRIEKIKKQILVGQSVATS